MNIKKENLLDKDHLKLKVEYHENIPLEAIKRNEKLEYLYIDFLLTF